MSVDTATGMIQGSSDEAKLAKRLAVAWQNPKSRQIQPVGLLTYAERNGAPSYGFHYVRNALGVHGFRPFLSFPDLFREYNSSRLFPLFTQRVMDARRPDFARYIQTLDLSPDASPWEQIARSEGRRVGDTIMVFPEPTVDCNGKTCSLFLVHGIRHVIDNNPAVEKVLGSLKRHVRLQLLLEPTNPMNHRAVCVASDGSVLGWVPDLLLDYVHSVLDTPGHRLEVRHANGPNAPTHLRLLVQLVGIVDPNYVPFSGQKWESLGH